MNGRVYNQAASCKHDGASLTRRTLDAALRHEAHANGRHVHINLGDAGPAALATLDQDVAGVSRYTTIQCRGCIDVRV